MRKYISSNYPYHLKKQIKSLNEKRERTLPFECQMILYKCKKKKFRQLNIWGSSFCTPNTIDHIVAPMNVLHLEY